MPDNHEGVMNLFKLASFLGVACVYWDMKGLFIYLSMTPVGSDSFGMFPYQNFLSASIRIFLIVAFIPYAYFKKAITPIIPLTKTIVPEKKKKTANNTQYLHTDYMFLSFRVFYNNHKNINICATNYVGLSSKSNLEGQIHPVKIAALN